MCKEKICCYARNIFIFQIGADAWEMRVSLDAIVWKMIHRIYSRGRELEAF